jgi:hypothetical protein
MFIRSRNVLLAAIAVSVLAGCQTTAPRVCDKTRPNVTYNVAASAKRRAGKARTATSTTTDPIHGLNEVGE